VVVNEDITSLFVAKMKTFVREKTKKNE